MHGIRRRRLFGIAVLGFLLAVAPAAWAVSVVINNVNLTGGGDTTWDPASDDYACTQPPLSPRFVPVQEGSTATRTDGFDGGFAVWVGGLNGKIFGDADGNGNRQGQTLKVGPTVTRGYKVSAAEKAIQTSPTLRMVFQFKNTSGHAVRREITVESNLGSDDETTVDASSNGNSSWNLGDRWLVSHEDPFGAMSDPVITQVWFGKHAAKRPVDIDHTATGAPPAPRLDCFATTFNLRVKPHKTKALMFFSEMNDGIGGATQKAGKFNKRHLTRKLLGGLGRRTKAQIVNWDL
jgi:hypothetical protein